jgi:pyruvate dehydrogenase E2 component (dihydrolipoamide acetyltransferase)
MTTACLPAGWDTQEDGVIAKLLVASGTNDIAVGQPLLVMVDSEDEVAAFADYTAEQASSKGSTGGGAGAGAAAGASAAAGDCAEAQADAGEGEGAADTSRAGRIGPAVRFLLETHGLDITDMKGSGPRGVVTKGDVLAAVEVGTKAGSGKQQAAKWAEAKPAEGKGASDAKPASSSKEGKPKQQAKPAAAPQQQGGGGAGGMTGRVHRGNERHKDIPVSSMRRVIAKRLLESKLTTPAIYVAADAKLVALTELRGALKTAGIKASVNDFVIKASAAALRAVPGACAGWDVKQEKAVAYDKVDISVAVATEGGLITPIVKGADAKSLHAVSKDVRDLAGVPHEPACCREPACYTVATAVCVRYVGLTAQVALST